MIPKSVDAAVKFLFVYLNPSPRRQTYFSLGSGVAPVAGVCEWRGRGSD
jgi:hypothetical protein